MDIRISQSSYLDIEDHADIGIVCVQSIFPHNHTVAQSLYISSFVSVPAESNIKELINNNNSLELVYNVCKNELHSITIKMRSICCLKTVSGFFYFPECWCGCGRLCIW